MNKYKIVCVARYSKDFLKYLSSHNKKLRKARKAYRCVVTNREIKVGDEYRRVNIKYRGVFHFHKIVDRYAIEDYLMNEVIMPNMSAEERDLMPSVWDTTEQEIWANMPDEF